MSVADLKPKQLRDFLSDYRELVHATANEKKRTARFVKLDQYLRDFSCSWGDLPQIFAAARSLDPSPLPAGVTNLKDAALKTFEKLHNAVLHDVEVARAKAYEELGK
jgi:hypothetical protein